MRNMINSTVRKYILLHIAFFIFSLSAIFAKLASRHDFFSFDFFMLFGANLLMLVIFALLWQIVLKKSKLSTAYANRGIVVIWGMLWGSLIFNEQLTIMKIIAAALIISGMIILGNANE